MCQSSSNGSEYVGVFEAKPRIYLSTQFSREEQIKGESKKQKAEDYVDFQHSRISPDDTTSAKNKSRFKRDHFLASVLVPSVKSDGITM